MRRRAFAVDIVPRLKIFAALAAIALFPTLSFGKGLQLSDSAADLHINPIAYLHRLLYAWDPQYFLGIHSGFMQVYLTPYTFAYVVLEALRVPAIAAQRIVIFLTCLLIAAGMYVSLKYIAPRISISGRLVAAMAACWNIYVAFNMHGSSAMLLPYATLPVFVAIYAAYLDGKIGLTRSVALLAAFSLIASGINPPLLAINVAVICIYWIVAILTSRQAGLMLKRGLVLSVVGGLIVLVVNFYWIVPFLDYFRTVWLGGVLVEPPSMHNADTSFANTLRGFGQWAIFKGDADGPYYAWATAYLGGTLFALSTWLQLGLSFASLLFRRSLSRAHVFFLGALAVALPLVVGYYEGPGGRAITSGLYDFLFTKVPGFQMFRSAYKWESVAVFCLAGLLGLFTSSFAEWLASRFSADRALRLREGTTCAVAAVLVLSFLPVLLNGMNPPEPDLPSWFYNEPKLVSASNTFRVALMPGQYLEQYLWGDPTYYIEPIMLERPLLFGYLGSAPLEGSDQWLHRAFSTARQGRPESASIFRFLSVDTILQRDDFKSVQDFAFPGRAVTTSASLAHDIESRVMAGTPLMHDGGLRTYALAGAVPIVRAARSPRLSPYPSDVFAASANPWTLAQGVAYVNPISMRMKDVERAIRAGALVQDSPHSLAAMTTTTLHNASIDSYAQSTTVALHVRVPDSYEVNVAVLGSHGDAVFEPSVIIDDQRTLTTRSLITGWNSFGSIYLSPGDHTFSYQGDAPDGVRVSLTPSNVWWDRYRALKALTAGQSSYSYSEVEPGRRYAFDIPRSGNYSIEAQHFAGGSEEALTKTLPPLSKSQLDPHFGFDRLVASRGEGVRLPIFPGRGTASSASHLLDPRWYGQSETYDWNRSAALSWTLLSPDAHFVILNPTDRVLNATISFGISLLSPKSSISFSINNQSVATPSLADTGAHRIYGQLYVKDLFDQPQPVEIHVKLRPGSNDLGVTTTHASGVSASVFSDAQGSALYVVGALPYSPTVSLHNVPPDLRVDQSEPIVDLASSKSRQVIELNAAGCCPIAPFKLALPASALAANPHIKGQISVGAAGGRAFLVVQLASGARGSSIDSIVREISMRDGEFDVPVADLLPNDFSDADKTIVGAWIVLADFGETSFAQSAASTFVVDKLAYSTDMSQQRLIGSPALLGARVDDGNEPPYSNLASSRLDILYPAGVAAKRATVDLPRIRDNDFDVDTLRVRVASIGLTGMPILQWFDGHVWRLVGRTIELKTGQIDSMGQMRLDLPPDTAATRSDVERGMLAVYINGTALAYTNGDIKPDIHHFAVSFDGLSGAANAIYVNAATPGLSIDDVVAVTLPESWRRGSDWSYDYSLANVKEGARIRLLLSFRKSQQVSQQREVTVLRPRVLRSEVGSSSRPHVLLDGKPLYSSTSWLARGRHVISTATGRGSLESVTVSPVEGAHEAPALAIRRVSPVLLTARAAKDERSPFLLTFGESFHPEWVASLNGKPLEHLQVNGYANGWIVPRMRAGDWVTVYFEGQRRFQISCLISIIGGMLLAVALIVSLIEGSKRRTELRMDGNA